MKLYALGLVCLAGLISGFSSCATGPVYDECLLTVIYDINNIATGAVADCIKPDKTLYELPLAKLDGFYMYSSQSRSNILTWAKSNCGRKGE